MLNNKIFIPQMCPLHNSLTRNESFALEAECRAEIRTQQRSSRPETRERGNIWILRRTMQNEQNS